MPIYDYKCPKCGHVEKDQIKKMDEKTMKCPKCGADMERMVGAGIFRFGRRGKIF